jgi:hypothetical protein
MYYAGLVVGLIVGIVVGGAAMYIWLGVTGRLR